LSLRVKNPEVQGDVDLGLRKARRGEESRKHLFFILKEDGKDDNSGR
jgi:hypothetical protein